MWLRHDVPKRGGQAWSPAGGLDLNQVAMPTWDEVGTQQGGVAGRNCLRSTAISDVPCASHMPVPAWRGCTQLPLHPPLIPNAHTQCSYPRRTRPAQRPLGSFPPEVLTQTPSQPEKQRAKHQEATLASQCLRTLCSEAPAPAQRSFMRRSLHSLCTQCAVTQQHA